jgi:chemotaxis response regulator CheB
MASSKISVLIIARFGAHQKAIKAMCASLPQLSIIDTVINPQQALDILEAKHVDLVILGANLPTNWICDLLIRVKKLPFAPYLIALTHQEINSCLTELEAPNQVVSTRSIVDRLPQILVELSSQSLTYCPGIDSL